MLRTLISALLLALPLTASASPITIQIASGTMDPATGNVDGGVATTAGYLSGELDGDLLSGLHGVVYDYSFGEVSVLDGNIDLSGNADSWFSTDSWGTFHITGSYWDGYYLTLWSTTTSCYWWGCKDYYWRLYGCIDQDDEKAIPEPSAALLFGLGAVVVSRRARRA